MTPNKLSIPLAMLALFIAFGLLIGAQVWWLILTYWVIVSVKNWMEAFHR